MKMRSLAVVISLALALAASSGVRDANSHVSRHLTSTGQIDDKLAHESDRDLVDDFILAYSVDFDLEIQNKLTSGQITPRLARSMKDQFYASGTGFADQIRDMFDAEYSSKNLPFDERLRTYLRKSIEGLWEGKALVP